eukprot:TRINITY_DN2035_c3_g3_i1.p1 TRINITY_DN2035_c3_g3~~TRINITY_DN2035_c3_g3_i1.p1  ORF type:complete len:1323 (+),score=336.16 TRINITY_DN2035_c3_g3_i1:90-3971(+)
MLGAAGDSPRRQSRASERTRLVYSDTPEARQQRGKQKILQARTRLLAELAMTKSSGDHGASPDSTLANRLLTELERGGNRSRVLDAFKASETAPVIGVEPSPDSEDDEPPPPELFSVQESALSRQVSDRPAALSEAGLAPEGPADLTNQDRVTELLRTLDLNDVSERLVTLQALNDTKDQEIAAGREHLHALRKKHELAEGRLRRELDQANEEISRLTKNTVALQKELEEVGQQMAAATMPREPVSPAADKAGVAARAALAKAAGMLTEQRETQELLDLRKRLQVQQGLMNEQMEELGRLRTFYKEQKSGSRSAVTLAKRILARIRDARALSERLKAQVIASLETLQEEVAETFYKVLRKLPPPPITSQHTSAMARTAADLHEQLSLLAKEHALHSAPDKELVPLQGKMTSGDPWDPSNIAAVTSQFTDSLQCITAMPALVGAACKQLHGSSARMQEMMKEAERRMRELREAQVKASAQTATRAITLRKYLDTLSSTMMIPQERHPGWCEDPASFQCPAQEVRMQLEQEFATGALLDRCVTVIDLLTSWYTQACYQHNAEKLALRTEVAKANAQCAQCVVELRSATADLVLTMDADRPWYGGEKRDLAPIDTDRDPQVEEFVNLKAADGLDATHAALRAEQSGRTVALMESLVPILGELGQHWLKSDEAHKQQKEDFRSELSRLENMSEDIETALSTTVAKLAGSTIPVREAFEELCEEVGLAAAAEEDPEIEVGGPPPATDEPPDNKIGFLRRCEGPSPLIGRILVEVDGPRRQKQIDATLRMMAAFEAVTRALMVHWRRTRESSSKLQAELDYANEQLVKTQENFEILEGELDAVKAEAEKHRLRIEELLAQLESAAAVASARRQGSGAEEDFVESFEKTIEDLVQRCSQVEMTAREKKEVSDLLVQVKELAREGAESTWKTVAARLTHEERLRRVNTGKTELGEKGGLDSLAMPSRAILERMCYCHRCGAGPHGPPEKKCGGCGANLYYGLSAGVAMGPRTLEMWRQQVADWLEKRRALAQRQQEVVSRLTHLVEGAEERQRREAAQRPQQHGAQRPVPAYVRLDTRSQQPTNLTSFPTAGSPTVVAPQSNVQGVVSFEGSLPPPPEPPSDHSPRRPAAATAAPATTPVTGPRQRPAAARRSLAGDSNLPPARGGYPTPLVLPAKEPARSKEPMTAVSPIVEPREAPPGIPLAPGVPPEPPDRSRRPSSARMMQSIGGVYVITAPPVGLQEYRRRSLGARPASAGSATLPRVTAVGLRAGPPSPPAAAPAAGPFGAHRPLRGPRPQTAKA